MDTVSGGVVDTSEITDPKNVGIAGSAGDAVDVHVPLRAGQRQFRFDGCAFREQADTTRSEQWGRQFQQMR